MWFSDLLETLAKANLNCLSIQLLFIFFAKTYHPFVINFQNTHNRFPISKDYLILLRSRISISYALYVSTVITKHKIYSFMPKK